MMNRLKDEMLIKNYKIKIVAANHLHDLQMEFEDLHNKQLHEDIYKLVKGFYNFDLSDYPYPVNSIIVVASACPQVKVCFTHKDRKTEAIIPPTYIDYVNEPVTIERFLNEILSEDGLQAKRVYSLPEKMLAVHSGLGSYGRNNICYVPDMGSFVLISAYYTDYKCSEDDWKDITLMEACKKCKLCMEQCPTGAISSDHSLVKAERCITYFNEFTNYDFPEWINPSAHNSIIGCMKCQLHCPQNAKVIANIRDGVEFDESETDLLLNKERLELLPEATIAKLKQLNLVGYYGVLSRNLKAILNKR